MSEAEERPWWAGVEAQVEKLARKIAERHGVGVDTMALPYSPLMFETGSGIACIVLQNDMRPLWTFEVWVARHALAAKDEQAVEDIVKMPASRNFNDAAAIVDDMTQWRKERGLDDEA